jgi:hypothetical protein
MPQVTRELHRRWHERIVSREFQLGGKDAALERGSLRPLDQSLPEEQIILVDRSGCDALGGILAESFVLLEEPFRRDRIHVVARVLPALMLKILAWFSSGWSPMGDEKPGGTRSPSARPGDKDGDDGDDDDYVSSDRSRDAGSSQE